MYKFTIILLAFLIQAFAMHSIHNNKDNNHTQKKGAANNDTTKLPKIKNGVPDTVAYLQSIKNSKNLYIGKAIAVLLSDLKISPKSYYLLDSRIDQSIYGITLYFDDKKQTQKKSGYSYPPALYITWKNKLSENDTQPIFSRSIDPGNWYKEDELFYSKQIIADIQVNALHK